jgi:CMP-N-acetylneuraminic acid synthetase
MKIAIIPARGGSAGLPNKNTKSLCGRPLIAHTIEAALGTNALDAVFVSTESDEIARVAATEGAQVIRHPAHLSGHDQPTAPVIAWALSRIEETGGEPEAIAVLRATTPLRTSGDIARAVDMLDGSSWADSVVSVTATGANPARLKRVSGQGQLENAFPGESRRPVRRQELETFFIRNGGVYLAKREAISAESLWGSRCLAYEMPPERSVNINTEFDFHVAELLLRDRLQLELQTQPL